MSLSTPEVFVLGGMAACCAVRYCYCCPTYLGLTRNYFVQVTVSNPAEVAKTRLQLQGELVKSGGVKVYQNTLDVLIKTSRNEGIRGIQKGLGPAVRGKT